MQGLPLRIAILWHNHQPYYEKEGEFILPWLRLHAVKDYLDLPLLLNEFPNIRQTLNIVPSIFLQINEYLKEGKYDTIQKLTRIPAKDLSIIEKKKISELFFICNEDNMIKPYERFNQLFERAKYEDTLLMFSEQDWLDLQVWYNLAWLGEFSKSNPFAKRLLLKGQNFSETEKHLLLELHDEIMSSIIPLYKRLNKLGQLELSTTPYFHPILPLVADFNSAKEANPENQSLEIDFKYPEDAVWQIDMAVNSFAETFGFLPSGFWPSEGSLSNEVLEVFADKKIKWVATDEEVLQNSETPKTRLEKYFPRKFISNNGSINIFFRDHSLSDKIGFQYSNWHPYDSAANFVQSLLEIRNSLIHTYGEESLKSAVVPIILDGENCWEFYPNNGIDFLRNLYRMLSENPNLKTITLSEALEDDSSDFLPALSKIKAGSWINANFDIWAGHQDDIDAWNMLSKARKLYEFRRDLLPKNLAEKVYHELLIAEGSDWFWWYGPEHNAPNKPDFDVLFRWHIKQIYEMMGEKTPEEVFEIIGSEKNCNPKFPNCKMNKFDFENNLENAGKFEFKQNFSTMHQAGKPNTILYFANDDEMIYFQVQNLIENAQENLLSINFGKKNIEINAENIVNSKIQEINLNEITENRNQAVPISLKLINLAEKIEINEKFDYLIQ